MVYSQSAPEKHSFVELYAADISSATNEFTITIKYQTPYYYNWSGFTKSSIYYYSNDMIYYDFSPAASWVKSPARELNVSIENKSAKGKIIFPPDWNFNKTKGGNYSSTLKPFSPQETKSLIIGVDQKSFKQYLSHQEVLDKINISSYSNDTLKHTQDRYNAKNAVDKKTETAWCSNKSKPRIHLHIKPIKTDQSYQCQFEGIGLMNGYARSKKIWEDNRKVKNGTIYINDLQIGKFDLSPIKLGAALYPYELIQHITSRTDNLRITSGSDYWKINSSQELNIIIEISDTYDGEKYEDLCISEIFPIYNCG